MKILHLADLHLGKKVNDFCMIKEQRFVLNQAIKLVFEQKIDAVLIAGDVFDRPIPSVSALEVFDNFLAELEKADISVFIISGNHDNIDRLAYLSSILKKNKIFVSGSFEGKIERFCLNDDTEIFLMPYLYPAVIRKYYPDEVIENYNDALKIVVNSIELDENKTNILLAHQFVTGRKEDIILSQSEQKSVAGLDEISYKIFDKFDYTALGHLHCPQKAGRENVFYAGSILKYSFSEINQKKKFCVLDINKKNIIKTFYPIKFLHEMKIYRGFIDEFLNAEFYSKINTDDYIQFILLDEYVLDAKKKLSMIYPNIMLLEFDNKFTRSLNFSFNNKGIENKTMFEHFCDFYEKQFDTCFDCEDEKIIKDIMEFQKEGI